MMKIMFHSCLKAGITVRMKVAMLLYVMSVCAGCVMKTEPSGHTYCLWLPTVLLYIFTGPIAPIICLIITWCLK